MAVLTDFKKKKKKGCSDSLEEFAIFLGAGTIPDSLARLGLL